MTTCRDLNNNNNNDIREMGRQWEGTRPFDIVGMHWEDICPIKCLTVAFNEGSVLYLSHPM